ncbi:beta-N-acetylhexosaminidase [Flavobacterium algicola]|uniref:beta-N-acetylhexosaminidase n=1 Tax=Flavobacterium algicola TaxID=556529 RepID=UPI001EFD0B10|nr:family 20 glycosylhydrolase [Flavobacterium algicola]MCG9793125.1 family 20 glycosylhydrolase [Flavobacterium algicola]
MSLSLAAIMVSCAKRDVKRGNLSIIPLPVEVIASKGYFILDKNTTISVENAEQHRIASIFFGKFKTTSGWIPKIETAKKDASIIFTTDQSLANEEYVLAVAKKSIQIKSNSGAGFFYALQSLGQLLPPLYYSKTIQSNKTWSIPVATLKDKPAFKWRGYMLDVSRHFFDKQQVKDVIDFMAEVKLNRFHWHLSDDNGWRIEIKKYPKLTEIGAWRLNENAKDEYTSNWWGRPTQKEGDMATYGGYYTQEDIKEIVAYAKERYIEVIAEIDIPGHSLAAVASYPEISCAKGPFYVGTGGVNKNNTLCPGKEVTFEFVEGVLTEVMDLFPFEYIHIGGDECNKDAWKVDPDCQQRMKDENLADEHELQSYFVKRVEKMVNARHKKMIGWDEILEGGLAPNATVMSWRGEKGGIAAARENHDVIMTPARYCYFDLKQGDDDLEPNLGYAYTFLKDTYNYKIVSDSLTAQQGEHVLGIQGNLWTESITNWGQLTYMTFPRLYAVAENGWTKQKSKDWTSFTDRLLTQFERLDEKGERYATSAYNVRIDHKATTKGTIAITLGTEVADLAIYYTTDGSLPTLNSKKYLTLFEIDKTLTLKATSFINNRQIGNISERYFPVHKGFGAQVIINSKNYNGKSLDGLVDLNYGKLNQGDKNWNVFTGDLDVAIVFPDLTEIEQLKITSLRFTISGNYVPENYELYGSKDGQTFVKITEVDLKEQSHTQGRNKVETILNFEKTIVKAIKVKAKSVNPIPIRHHQAGNASKIMIDEIVIF